MNFNFNTPQELMMIMANNAKAKRLSMNLTQKTLADNSGVAFGSIKLFEKSGKISLESLLKIALVLDSLNDFNELFKYNDLAYSTTLEDLIKQPKRKRGRK